MTTRQVRDPWSWVEGGRAPGPGCGCLVRRAGPGPGVRLT